MSSDHSPMSAVYLDHAGAGQYLPEQIDVCMNQLKECLLSNPHSRSASSKLTNDLVDQARYSILEHFKTTNEEYNVIFTSGCTAALKLVSECLDWNSCCSYCQKKTSNTNSVSSNSPWHLIGPTFVYLMDNHTSVIGMRQYPLAADANTLCLHPEEVDEFLDTQKTLESQIECQCLRLFAFPGQSNFCGYKYIENGWIRKFHQLNQRWLVCMDAAALVSTCEYDLNYEKPDFFTISFYKIFGYPTGLGALLVRNETVGNNGVMKKKYFGGGTVNVALNKSKFISFRDDLSERFEDGTIAFQQILALKHGFDSVKSKGRIRQVSSDSFSLANLAYRALTSIKHANGTPIAIVYCRDNFKSSHRQGPIVNFNLLRSDGSYVGYSEAEKIAELYNIHWRTGCFCNQGACQMYLNLTDEKLMKNFESGKVCGDRIDLVDGEPVGSIRISFGWTSTLTDVQRFIQMLQDCFVEHQLRKSINGRMIMVNFPSDNGRNIVENGKEGQEQVEEAEEYFDATDFSYPLSEHTTNHTDLFLTDIYIYPVKSCGQCGVNEWTIGECGLEYDRHWMVVSNEGLYLNQKRDSKLCTIIPRLDLDHARLILSNSKMKCTLDIEIGKWEKELKNGGIGKAINGEYCQSKICADRVSTVDCGDQAGLWIDQVLGRNKCRLVEQTDHISRNGKGSQDTRVSLANEEQYLLLHRPSIRRLLSRIRITSSELTEDELIQRFRPNLVVDGGVPFEEDWWKSLNIGNVQFQCVGKCTRCQMICIDQRTGEVDKNILLTLRQLRDNKTTFGIYLQTERSQCGRKVRVGQETVIVDRITVNCD